MDRRLRDALRAVTAAAQTFLDSTDDLQGLLQTVVKSVAEAVPDMCSISLRTGPTMTLVALHDANPAIRGVYTPLMNHPRKISSLAETALMATVFTPTLDFDALAKVAPPDSLAILQGIGAKGMIVIPLKTRRELIGLMTIVRHRAELPPLDETDRDLAEFLADHAALALGLAKLEGERTVLEHEVAASRFLDAVVENIPDMVFVKDATELRFVRFNKAGEELLGIPRGELIGKNDFDFFPTEEAEFFIQKDRETLSARRLVDIPEEPIRTKHGERWLHTKKVPIVDDAGTPRFLLGISEDITERKRAITALREAKDRAEAANRELESFSYSVAHDLRAPLRAIDGFAQALLEDYGERLDVIGHRHLERIRAAAQRMAMLIDDLLRLSRVSRHDQRNEGVDLSSLARISVAQLERAEPTRDVEIVIADNLHAHGDPKLLAILFDNLLGNAWKFTAKAPRPRIELGTLNKASETVYYVRDNGAGFDMTYENKLFGVFQRLHPAHEYPGTGIGLATVKRIVERHGGRVWAEGAVDHGATFYFTLGDLS